MLSLNSEDAALKLFQDFLWLRQGSLLMEMAITLAALEEVHRTKNVCKISLLPAYQWWFKTKIVILFKIEKIMRLVTRDSLNSDFGSQDSVMTTAKFAMEIQ